jgi:hypothetical protein
MSLLQLNLTNVKEPQPVPEGQYLLRVLNAELGKSKSSGKDQMSVNFTIDRSATGESVSNAKTVYEYYGLPNSDDNEEDTNFKLLKFKRLFSALGVSADNGVDTSALVGRSAWAHLTLKEDEGFEPSNRIKRWIGKN